MQTQTIFGYEQVLYLINLLPQTEKNKLFNELQKDVLTVGERKLGKYQGQGWMSDDFNEPLEEFKDYMP